jgi:hypothetical protein
MFTRDEALALWDDLTEDIDAFLTSFGEIVLIKHRNVLPHVGFILGDTNKDSFGYFIRAKNYCFTKEMLNGYNRACEKHKCTYRIEGETITFYKDRRDT